MPWPDVRRPILLDCDTGTDDAIALMAAFASPEVQVVAVTSVNGNVTEDLTSRNNLDLTAYLGQDIPVARGAVRPLLGGFLNDGSLTTHGPTGMGNVTLPTADHARFHPLVASELIYEKAKEYGGALELVVTGPQTNVALALCNHRDLPGLIKHLWFMGGACQGGNVLPAAEFNIWCDPEAAKIVLGSGIPLTMVGLDVTLKASMTQAEEAVLRAKDTKTAQLSAQLLRFMLDRRDKGGEDALMHDALALCAALRPEFFRFREYFVDVVTTPGYTYGHTYVDIGRRYPGKSANVSVALEIDVAEFRKWLVETLSLGV